MAAQKLEKLVFPEKLLQKNTGADALHKKLKVSLLQSTYASYPS